MYKTIVSIGLVLLATQTNASDYNPRYTDTPYCKWDYSKKATACYNRGKRVSEEQSDTRKDVDVEIKNKKYTCNKQSGSCKSSEKSKN